MNMNIALCTDDNYANHCAICVTSILENNKDNQCHIYILTNGLTESNEKKFEELSKYYKQNIEIKTLDMYRLEGLQETNHLGRSMYFRFMLPEVVAGNRVLYLDCDIIVRNSLADLFATDLAEFACGVVEDQCGDDVRLHNPIMMFSRYFNSGVLFMNLDYWRKNNVAQDLVDFIANFKGQLMCPDQDALNAVLEGKVKFLDYKYNYQQGFYGDLTWLRADKWPAIKETGKNPVVVHYTAGEKPWHKDCKHPLKAEYDNYMHLHTVLLEKKMPGHRWYFYVIEGIIDKLRSIYQWYRSKNGMVVNKA